MRRYVLATVLSLLLATWASGARAQETRAGSSATQPATSATQTRPAETQPSLSGARKLHWEGRYAEAAEMYRKLLDAPAGAVPAAIGLAEALATIGRYDEAQAALQGVAARAAADAEWHVAQAELAALVGRYEDSLASARKAFERRPDWAPAIRCLGQALETIGKKKEAIEVYKGLDKAIENRQFAQDARSLVAAGKVLDRYAILTGQKASDQAQNILHNYLQKAYQDVDKTYWPANIAAGIFLLSKYKYKEAGQEFALADTVNRHIPDVCVGRGYLHLVEYRFEQALAEADKALKINPRHADALILKAATLMLWQKFDEARPVIEQVFAFNPNHLEALSLMAALHIRTLTEDQAEPFIRRVEKINPQYAELHEVIGDWLSAGRQFKQAEKHFLKAMELAPELAGPVTGLGRVYMQTGREELAKKTLDKAFSIDNYRGDVMNYLNLLDRLEKFQVRQTEHFIIKVDGKTDAVLLDWVAEVAEKIHADVCKDFDHVPEKDGDKTLVELFPDQAQFSVRISGRGWIPTIGACTGRVIAMPAPDPLRGGFGSFNWAVVLRHEYTHTVTLSATENRIPHWFTEACAVWEQPDRRNFEAVALLVEAVRRGQLYPVTTLDWGFIRPDPRRGPQARGLAYAQAEWIFEYVVEKKGYDAIPQMLRGFRDGLTQAKVFDKVLATTQEQFDKDFADWAKVQVASWGFDPEPPPPVDKAREAAKANPQSADAQANLARALYHARQFRQAEAPAREALRIDPNHKQALAVLGYVLLPQRKYEEVLQIGKRLEEVDARSADAARLQAEAYLAQQKWLEAIAALENFKSRRQLDPFAYEKLARLYDQLGEPEKALPNLAELHRRTMRDPKYARQVADIYRTSDTPEKALDFWEQVIQINPYDAGVYKAMASLYLRAKNYQRAILAMHSACLLEPDSADSWANMAAVYFRVGKAEKSVERLSQAVSAAEKALGIDPTSPAAQVKAAAEELLTTLHNAP